MKKIVLFALLAALSCPLMAKEDKAQSPTHKTEMHFKNPKKAHLTEAEKAQKQKERKEMRAEKQLKKETNQVKSAERYKKVTNKEGSKIQKLIDDGIADGSLTTEEATEIKTAFDVAKAKSETVLTDKTVKRGEVGPVREEYLSVMKLIKEKRTNDVGVKAKLKERPVGKNGNAKGPRGKKDKKSDIVTPAESTPGVTVPVVSE